MPFGCKPCNDEVQKMSKLLPTLFAVLLLAFIGGVAFLIVTDVPVVQEKVESTVTYADFKAKNNP